MIARLLEREPSASLTVNEVAPDTIPWGTPYTPGDELPPSRVIVPEGDYVLMGEDGYADVSIVTSASRFKQGEEEIESVSVVYHNYSSDRFNYVDGSESGTRISQSGVTTLTWQSDLTFSGLHSGSRKSDELEGFVVTSSGLGTGATFSGEMITTLDDSTYNSPVTP